MQKVLSGIFLFTLLDNAANAALLSRLSGQAYYDDVFNITWIADANLAATNDFGVAGINANGSMTWYKANEWIAEMNNAAYLGKSDWRLPITTQPDSSCENQYDRPEAMQGYGLGCTGSELTHLANVDGINSFTPSPFTNVQAQYYWTGTSYVADGDQAWIVDFDGDGTPGYLGVTDKIIDETYHTWVVSPGDIAPVPIPAAAWLIAPAFGLLAPWVRRKKAE